MTSSLQMPLRPHKAHENDLQLDLFAVSASEFLALPETSSACEFFSESDLFCESVQPFDQLDLFINTPFDQALSALRRALLRNALESAQQYYETALNLAHKPFDDQPLSTALADAKICLRHLQNRGRGENPKADWRALHAHRPAIQRFMGDASAEFFNNKLRVMATQLDLVEFDPDLPNAYAAQIWFDLGEFSFAKAILDRDMANNSLLADTENKSSLADTANKSRLCPFRLVLNACTAAQLNLKPQSLRFWQTLCFDWPEHAEDAISHSPQFSVAWAGFCELEPPQPMSIFPAFAALNHFAWPEPDGLDQRPGAQQLRAAISLSSNRSCVATRMILKATSPTLFQAWLTKRG